MWENQPREKGKKEGWKLRQNSENSSQHMGAFII